MLTYIHTYTKYTRAQLIEYYCGSFRLGGVVGDFLHTGSSYTSRTGSRSQPAIRSRLRNGAKLFARLAARIAAKSGYRVYYGLVGVPFGVRCAAAENVDGDTFAWPSRLLVGRSVYEIYYDVSNAIESSRDGSGKEVKCEKSTSKTAKSRDIHGERRK